MQDDEKWALMTRGLCGIFDLDLLRVEKSIEVWGGAGVLFVFYLTLNRL